MDDALCKRIVDVCRAVEEANARRTHTDSGQPLRENLDDYFSRAIYPRLRLEFPEVDPCELAVVGLMGLLGPAHSAFPPEPLREALVALVRDLGRTEDEGEWLEWVVQFALAYGGGWKRTVNAGNPDWDEPYWGPAVQELVKIAWGFTTHAYNVLARTVREFRSVTWDEETIESIDSDCARMVIWFCCAKPTLADKKYKQYRSLRFWDPKLGNLYAWLKGAIAGREEGPDGYPANYFWGGWLYEAMKQRGTSDPNLDTVVSGKVAFQKCGCGALRREYDGCECSTCGGTMLVTFQNLLVVPWVYVGKNFWHCSNKEDDHYFEFDRSHCPACGIQRPAKATILLVRAEFSSSDSLGVNVDIPGGTTEEENDEWNKPDDGKPRR